MILTKKYPPKTIAHIATMVQITFLPPPRVTVIFNKPATHVYVHKILVKRVCKLENH